MKKLISLILGLILSNGTLAAGLDGLDTLVKNVCLSPSQAGKYWNVTTAGKASANGTIRLISAGINGEASFTKGEWEGVQQVLKSQQQTENANYRECAIRLTALLLPKFSSSQQKTDSDSDLRLEIQGLSQGIGLVAKEQPKINDEPVMCDTAKFTLLLDHNDEGKHPLLVNKIAIKVEKINPGNEQVVDCTIDTLSSKPFGIVIKNTYILDISNKGNSGRFIKSANTKDVFNINPDNILNIANEKKYITLKPGEEPISYDVIVTAKTEGLYRVWFYADYDANGSRTISTKSFVIGKSK